MENEIYLNLTEPIKRTESQFNQEAENVANYVLDWDSDGVIKSVCTYIPIFKVENQMITEASIVLKIKSNTNITQKVIDLLNREYKTKYKFLVKTYK